MKKPRFRKGKKATRQADLWLVYFGMGWNGSPKQLKLVKRYINALNRWEEDRKAVAKIGLAMMTVALGRMQLMQIVAQPILKDGTEKTQRAIKALKIAKASIDTAIAFTKALTT